MLKKKVFLHPYVMEQWGGGGFEESKNVSLKASVATKGEQRHLSLQATYNKRLGHARWGKGMRAENPQPFDIA